MAHYNRDWDDLGRSIERIVDRAVNSHDYQKLDQTIRQVIECAVDLGGDVVRKATARPEPKPGYQSPQPAPAPRQDLSLLYGKTNGSTAGGIVKIVGGGLAAGVSALLGLSNLAYDLFFFGSVMLTPPILVSLVGMALGAGFIGSGVHTLNMVSRFKKYRRELGQKTQCALEKLARSVGRDVKFVRKEVQKMIDRGLFLQGHLDKEQTLLITSDETYRSFEQNRLLLEQRQRQQAEEAKAAAEVKKTRDPRVQEVLDKGNAFVAEIRRCNDAIPGEEISAKIDRMELIVRRIFRRAETCPEIIPDLKKLMDYYLPMTVKLLNAYADMDAQPVQGETIAASKREIEATLDTLNLAFEKLLDDLFRDTAMDVSSDISVLHTLLAQEGLTEDGLTKMKKEK